MNFINKQALFILTGYNYPSVDDFKTAAKASVNCSEILNDFDAKQIENIKINGSPIPKSILAPLIVYYHKNKTHQIRFNRLVKQLEIATKIYEEEKDYLANIVQTFAQLKLQDIHSLEINFMVYCDKGDDRLCFFNQQINEKLNIFNFNKGFEISLPVDLSDKFGCNAGYTIAKTEEDDNDNKHVYVIEARYSFPFKTDNADSEGRVKELKEFVQKIPPIYEHYNKTCEEIVKLCH